MSRRMDDEDENVSSSDSGSGSDSSSDDSSSENSGTSSGDDSEDDESTQKMMGRGSAPGAGANTVQNQPHDEEFAVDNSGGTGAAPPPAAGTTSAAPAAGSAPPPGGDGNKIANQPHDESFAVDGGDGGSGNQSQTQPAPTKKVSNVKPSISSSGQMKNDPNDEAFDVENDMSSDEDEDSDEDEAPPQRTGGQSGSQVIKNRPEDEAFEVDNGGSSASAAAGGTGSAAPAPAPVQKQPAAMPTNNNNMSSGSMQGGGAGGDSSEEDEETGTDTSTEPDTDEEEESVPRMGPGNAQLQQTTAVTNNTSLEYNPADYEFLNAKVSREVRDLFSHISAYQPTTIECPAKLRPFIPEYIPCVGDIDTFCKVPRPDEKPDNFGLTVVDEPSCDQSNPFVVKIALSHTITAGVGGLSDGGNVAMVDEAHLHPQQIDKWISDIKKVSKQLPTVTYTKPMPQIESLMQIWPKEFEDMLNSDVAFPGSGIELDIDQYVRVLCAILDIPTYTNLVESLHVMFTLYLEFRANQHFTHA